MGCGWKYLIGTLTPCCMGILFTCGNAFSQDDSPSNKKATKETVNLYGNLRKLASKGFMFGHQDDLAYGVNWKYKDDHSDVKDAAGDYPALYGWELGGIERENNAANLDGVPFNKMRQFIRQGYERGGVISISWHAASPFGNAKGAWDTTHGSVASILPGGPNHDLYKSWLDRVASFLSSLKGAKGEAIPILFRPFHEHSGNWFWWGRNACSAEQYATLWRFSVYYLQTQKKLNNLLFVYNTAGDFRNRDEFLEGYPGDDIIDVLSFDAYQYNDPQKDNAFVVNTNKSLALVGEIAKEKNKLFALAETGYEAIPYASWWTETLSRAIGDNHISYVLVWRNHGYNESMKTMHYYAPYKGQVSQPDFIKFYELEKTLFGKDINSEKLYQ
jgi:mannan endo-1,4-beta-mannosidase